MPISLFVTLDKNKVHIGDLPEVTVRLINEGQEMVIVNGRLLVAPLRTPDSLKEISFVISGPEGSMNLRKVRVNSGQPNIDNFVRLFPGEYIFKTYDLSRYFSYKVSGNYKVAAEYCNTMNVVVDITKSWVGEIRSNEESFEII